MTLYKNNKNYRYAFSALKFHLAACVCFFKAFFGLYWHGSSRCDRRGDGFFIDCIKKMFPHPLTVQMYCTSWLPLWLMPSLLDLSFGGWLSLGRFDLGPYSSHFLIMDLMVLHWIFKVFHYFFFFYNLTFICTSPELCPWPVCRAPWSSWGCLLGGPPCLMVFQTPGPFKTVVCVCIYSEIMCGT